MCVWDEALFAHSRECAVKCDYNEAGNRKGTSQGSYKLFPLEHRDSSVVSLFWL